MKYLVNPESRRHSAIHFGKPEKAGSYFFTSVFQNVEELLTVLEKRDPFSVIVQSSGREAHTYDLTDIGDCGTVGLGLKCEFTDRKIKMENRNGIDVQYIEVDQLHPTSLLTVICFKEEQKYQLITAFPGDYAPAFPHDKMDSDELSWSMAFWDKHILFKKI